MGVRELIRKLSRRRPRGLSFDEARRIANGYRRGRGAVWFEHREPLTRARYFFFPVGFIGSMGVVVNRADGRLTVLGSAGNLDDWLWAYERGFLAPKVTLRITWIGDFKQAVEIVRQCVQGAPPRTRDPFPGRAWARAALATLPAEFPGQTGLPFQVFRQALAEEILAFELRAER
jgi:hypothetical protein